MWGRQTDAKRCSRQPGKTRGEQDRQRNGDAFVPTSYEAYNENRYVLYVLLQVEIILKKIPILYFIRKKIALHVHVEFCIPIYCDFSLVRGVTSTLGCGHSLSQSVLPVENGEGNFQDNR